MLIKKVFDKAIKRASNSARIGNMTYKQFGEAIKQARKKLGKRKIIFAEGTKFEQAITIFAALTAGKIVVPITLEYGKERCEQMKSMCMKSHRLHNVATILFTSGTSGYPKGIMLSERALIKNVEAITDYMGSKYRSIAILRPLVHSAVFTGELLLAVLNGWSISFWEGGYQPVEIYTFLQCKQIDLAGMTPTMLKGLLRIHAVPPLKEIILSGERLMPSDANTFTATLPGCLFYSVYGLTECGPRVSALPPYLFNVFPGSVGKPIAGVRIKIKNGELFVKTPCHMKGYLSDCIQTKNKMRHGWIRTGDAAEFDRFQNLYILGRTDDMIIRGGVNIYPAEVENILMRFSGVRECVVYGVTTSQNVRIAVEYTGNATEQEVADYAAKNLPAYLVPQIYCLRDSLSKTPSGKIIRKK